MSRYVTFYLAPIGLALSFSNMLPISFFESLLGGTSAFLFLHGIAWSYKKIRNRVGMGDGDIDLLTMIGAFIGIQGWWISLFVASILGTMIGIIVMLYNRQYSFAQRIPFGPFLAAGALSYVFFCTTLENLFFFTF